MNTLGAKKKISNLNTFHQTIIPETKILNPESSLPIHSPFY